LGSGAKSAMGIRSQVRKTAKIGFNQSLLYTHTPFPHSHPNFFICPISTQ
jgi:hypothetical protein